MPIAVSISRLNLMFMVPVAAPADTATFTRNAPPCFESFFHRMNLARSGSKCVVNEGVGRAGECDNAEHECVQTPNSRCQSRYQTYYLALVGTRNPC